MQIITGKTGSNHVTSDDDRNLHAGIFGNGSYVLNTGLKLSATIESANVIRLASGDICHQGTHARIPFGEYEDVQIDNGTTGYKRKDLIVARYEKAGGIESMSIEVIKGTPAASDPMEPEYNDADILEGATLSDMPLYVVTLDGVNIDSVIMKSKIANAKLADIFNMVYPVGSIYMSVLNVSPSTLFGGTWERWSEGRVPIGLNENDTRFNSTEKEGGAYTHNHELHVNGTKLTIDQIPPHAHEYRKVPNLPTIGYQEAVSGNSAYSTASYENTETIGGGQAHIHTASSENESNLQPYITCYMWKRTA